MRSPILLLAAAVALCCGTACGPRTLAPTGDYHDVARRQLACGSGAAMEHFYPQGRDDRLDLVFVLDTSPSMAPHRQRVIAQLPTMVDAMKRPGGGDDYPDLRVAVISADLGGAAALGCSADGDGARPLLVARDEACPLPADPWLSLDLAGKTNLVGGSADPGQQIAEALACTMRGEDGCSLQQPLEALRRALDPEVGTLKAMRRPGARLMVVIITDKDDCSVADPAFLAQDGASLPLRCLRAGSRCAGGLETPGDKGACEPNEGGLYPLARYLALLEGAGVGTTSLVVIGGPSTPLALVARDGELTLAPSCKTAQGSALPAPRLGALVDALTYGAEFLPLCADSFSEALALDWAAACSLGASCIDASPLTERCESICADEACDSQALPGADCVAQEVFAHGTDKERVELLPRCPAALFDPSVTDCGAHCPCWRLIPDEGMCAPAFDVPPLELDVMRETPRFSPRVVVLTCSAPEGYELGD